MANAVAAPSTAAGVIKLNTKSKSSGALYAGVRCVCACVCECNECK